NGEGDRRFGQMDLGILNGGGLVAEGVTSKRVFELGNGADIARVKLVHWHSRFALHDRDVRQLLCGTAGKILDACIVFQNSGEDFEVGNASGEDVVDCL